jgi:diamine N-acetyltransferase
MSAGSIEMTNQQAPMHDALSAIAASELALNAIPTLTPLRHADFDTVASLARRIWVEHYSTIISMQQIEYMLDGRFTASNLERYLEASDRWMRVLRIDDSAVGYCSYSLTGRLREMKLEQLYLLSALHGRGLGRLMLEYVEKDSRLHGCDTLMLQVNKRNTTAIEVYRRSEFTVREEIVLDIGKGYVMDDFIMAKRLHD